MGTVVDEEVIVDERGELVVGDDVEEICKFFNGIVTWFSTAWVTGGINGRESPLVVCGADEEENIVVGWDE